MRLLLAVPFAVLVVLAVAAPSALGARGDGPYTPFPEEDPIGRALDFVGRLNSDSSATARELTPEQLAEGVVLRPRNETRGKGRAERTPFRQAGVARASDPSSPAGWPFAVVAAVLAGGGLLIAARGAAGSARQRDGALP